MRQPWVEVSTRIGRSETTLLKTISALYIIRIQIIKNHTFRKIIKLDSVPLMDIESIAS